MVLWWKRAAFSAGGRQGVPCFALHAGAFAPHDNAPYSAPCGFAHARTVYTPCPSCRIGRPANKGRRVSSEWKHASAKRSHQRWASTLACNSRCPCTAAHGNHMLSPSPASPRPPATQPRRPPDLLKQPRLALVVEGRVAAQQDEQDDARAPQVALGAVPRGAALPQPGWGGERPNEVITVQPQRVLFSQCGPALPGAREKSGKPQNLPATSSSSDQHVQPEQRRQAGIILPSHAHTP